MLQSKTVLSLTIDLLANNAFNHLKDEEISALHHLILKLQDLHFLLLQCLKLVVSLLCLILLY